MKILFFPLVLIIFLSQSGYPHARMKSDSAIVPRNSSDSLKTGPCGGVARTSAPKVYAPGSTITVKWEETINHPGRFEFYFSAANDTNFVLLKTVNDTMDSSNDLPHQYSTTVTLPSTPCENCTLQMIQVMTDRSPPSNYYSCADIRIQGATVAPGTPADTVDDCQTKLPSQP
jgi:hypothetical protein